jgi:hypothetical protein
MAGICCSIASRSQRLSGAHEGVVDGDRSSARGNLHSTAAPHGEPALDQRPRADILAVEIQKIEQGEDQRRGNAARMRKAREWRLWKRSGNGPQGYSRRRPASG